MSGARATGGRILAGATALLSLAACEQLERGEPALPAPEEAAAFYDGAPDLVSVEVSGNLVELHVRQPVAQLERGGPLWAKVGPYIYLLSPGTRDLFQGYPGVAAVRVVTYAGEGPQVAQAMLRRDALSDILWRRSLNLLGRALQDGTEQPRRLEELVAWGERYAEYAYSPEYVP